MAGFRLHRIDRNVHGGGLMVYIRADIFSSVFKILDHTGLSTNEWGNFKTEFIAVKVNLKKEWVIVVGVYRPPSILKCQWNWKWANCLKL